ncbi:hypothetical protein PR202_ga29870 [Eleusine coracana subsp. coracana]|uniref:Endonuclease/exonuclease/phosphatase domain-containing protein n=1 Tax=Eleusine coracana subsp. coracana TaxID=191504 RepID=A0AAV5DN65_ELECO|nr:hypothetical protein PR202_ga29870 [Eleusine coracana subsp. coracana]
MAWRALVEGRAPTCLPCLHLPPLHHRRRRWSSIVSSTATSPLEVRLDGRAARSEGHVGLPEGELKWPKKEIKFMIYNVWSRDDVFVHKRMQAIGSLVEKHDPDVIFFQLSKRPLENFAHCKFDSSSTGKGYLEADINPDPVSTLQPIHVATTQLERPAPSASMYNNERRAQAQQAIAAFSSAANVVFGGDMSWRDDNDGPFPLATGWSDAWTKLRSSFRSSWTYEGIWNEEGGVFNGHVACRDTMRKRSDRFVCKLKDYRLSSIELIGDHTIGPRETERSGLAVTGQSGHWVQKGNFVEQQLVGVSMSSHSGPGHGLWKDCLKIVMIPDELMDTLVDFANTFTDDHVYDDDDCVDVPSSSECLDSTSDDLIGCSTSVPNVMTDDVGSLDLVCSSRMTSADDAYESFTGHASDTLVKEFFAFRANENEDLLDSLIRLRGIMDRIGATTFEVPKIVIVEKILTLLPSSKLLYITLDLIMEKGLSVEDVIGLLFDDEKITASWTREKTSKANGASSRKGKEVASSSNFFYPSTRLPCSSFYNLFGSRPTPSSSSGASSSSTPSAIPSAIPSTSSGPRIGVGGALINSFRGLWRIALLEVIDELLQQITTPKRGFLLEEVINRRHELSIETAMEMIRVPHSQVGHVLEHVTGLYDPPNYYITLDNVHMGDGHGQQRYHAPHYPIRRRLQEGIAKNPNYEDGLMTRHDEVAKGEKEHGDGPKAKSRLITQRGRRT